HDTRCSSTWRYMAWLYYWHSCSVGGVRLPELALFLFLNFLLLTCNSSIMSQQFSTDKAPKPVGLYPHAKRVGNFLFLSGVGPRKAGTDEIPGLKTDKHGNYLEFDFEAQCRSVFDNVRVILEH